jgi:hypothetical protein
VRSSARWYWPAQHRCLDLDMDEANLVTFDYITRHVSGPSEPFQMWAPLDEDEVPAGSGDRLE